jgi:catalase
MMRPHEPFLSISDEQRQKADDNFLFENLRQRLAQKPSTGITFCSSHSRAIRWMTLPSHGRTIAKVVAGTLEVTRVEAQSTGACRDVNFDPSVVPAGVAVSDDPILNARSAAYSHSFSRRERKSATAKPPKPCKSRR